MIRWLNDAAREWVGDIRGRQFTSVIAPEARRRSQQVFAQKMVGNATTTTAELVALDPNGERIHVEVTSVPLIRGGHVIGVFGLVPSWRSRSHLTTRRSHRARPRSCSCSSTGARRSRSHRTLHLSKETVRNHVRGLLRALGVNSRIEAVALARREHLLAN